MNVGDINFKKFREDFEEVIRPLSAKYKVQFSLGTISYSNAEFSTKLKAIDKEQFEKATESGLTPQLAKLKLEFHKSAFYFAHSNSYAKVIEKEGKRYVLVGLKTRGAKYPLVMMNLKNGKLYKGPDSWSRLFWESEKVYDFKTKTIKAA